MNARMLAAVLAAVSGLDIDGRGIGRASGFAPPILREPKTEGGGPGGRRIKLRRRVSFDKQRRNAKRKMAAASRKRNR